MRLGAKSPCNSPTEASTTCPRVRASKAFSEAIRSGALGSLKILDLGNNRIGDEGLKSFSAAVASGAADRRFGLQFIRHGALAQLQELSLGGNKIGDEGMKSFSAALASGALANCQRLFVDDGPLGTEHPALKAACEARGIAM